jgi:hypothetical protein
MRQLQRNLLDAENGRAAMLAMQKITGNAEERPISQTEAQDSQEVSVHDQALQRDCCDSL